jgi:GNAT superfamily N-acetyltransferase
VDDTLDRMIATMRSAWRTMAETAPEGSWYDEDGVGAATFPRVPDRSVFNSVIYERGADVVAKREQLDAVYVASGVNAWTVWVPEDDTDTATALERAGHVLDGYPAAMVLDLNSFEPPAEPECDDWGRATNDEMGDVNEVAYDFNDGSFVQAAEAMDADRFHLYAARDGDRALCVLGVHDCAGDAGIFFVGTRPDARGRGLAGALLGQALAEAHGRGNDISTLQATKMGTPVYARLGYRHIGRMQMWERRRA